MFSLPTPYASTAKARNEVRDGQVREALIAARNLLQDMAAEMTTLVEGVQDPTLWQDDKPVDAGLAYGRASYVSRDVMAIMHRLRDLGDSTTRAMVIAGGYEVEEQPLVNAYMPHSGIVHLVPASDFQSGVLGVSKALCGSTLNGAVSLDEVPPAYGVCSRCTAAR